ncbi:hypothetical protein PIB30_009806 [Stylosanthes scabra]|uniref:Transmembrane protein n=1 Tax=Stylosanthes scabra TaxID=79078 RepID=A0ABU6Y5F5_9FABA|nr:hypothetical protein [Stylosanthes scabra]
MICNESHHHRLPSSLHSLPTPFKSPQTPSPSLSPLPSLRRCHYPSGIIVHSSSYIFTFRRRFVFLKARGCFVAAQTGSSPPRSIGNRRHFPFYSVTVVVLLPLALFFLLLAVLLFTSSVLSFFSSLPPTAAASSPPSWLRFLEFEMADSTPQSGSKMRIIE